MSLAGLFFSAYEYSKQNLSERYPHAGPVVHMVAAAIGETVACLVRVPTENVKQKMQIGLYKTTGETVAAIRAVGVLDFYRGYFTTVSREVCSFFLNLTLLSFYRFRLHSFSFPFTKNLRSVATLFSHLRFSCHVDCLE